MEQKIREIIKGLSFESEADYPLEFFASHTPPKGEAFDFVLFMDELINQDVRYWKLKDFLLANTNDCIVIHSGDRYYFIGSTPSQWIGAQVQAVET